MRILHLDHSGEPGGGQLGLQRLAVMPKRHDHVYLFMTGGPILDRLKEQQIDARMAGNRGASVFAIIRHRSGLRKALERLRPDIIVANSLRAGIAAAAARPRIPIVYYIRQDMTPQSVGTFRKLVLDRFVYPRFDFFLANSEYTVSTVPQRLLTGRSIRVAYPVSGISDQCADTVPHEAIRSSGPPGPIELLWMGRIVHWKGLHVALDALERLKYDGVKFRLTVAGAPIHGGEQYAQQMRARAQRLGDAVRFLGHVEDVQKLLRESDILVHTSIIPEPFGQVLAQGMQAGLAVVSVNAGGPREIISSGNNGILVAPRSSTELAASIRSLASNSDERLRLGRNAASFITENFSDSSLVEQFESSIEAFVGST